MKLIQQLCGLLLSGVMCLAALTTTASAAPQIQHWTTTSGVRVFLVETHVLPIVDVQIDFAAGGAYAPVGKAGLASLTHGLLTSGTARLNEEAIAERLADLGANLGGTVDMDRASFTLRTLSSATERDGSVSLLADMLQTPSFPADVLAREKERAIAGIREQDTKPEAQLSRRFMQAVYGDHPYARSATAESVASLTRDDLVSFYRTRYGARRASIAIVGDVTRAEAERIANQLTQSLPDAPADEGVPAASLPNASTIYVSHHAQQSHIAIGMPALMRGDSDFFALQLGNYILGGGGFASRLTNEVREKRGYAYSVYSYFMAQRGKGPFQIGLQTKRSQAGAALKVVNDTLNTFLRDGPTAAELKAAKQNLVDGFVLRLDSNRKLLDLVATIGYFGLPLEYIEQYPQKVSAVTLADIRTAFARKLPAGHFVTVVVAGDEPAAVTPTVAPAVLPNKP